MDVTEVKSVANYETAPKKSIHQLIEQLESAVLNQSDQIKDLIGVIQQRCLGDEKSVGQHLEDLARVFIELAKNNDLHEERYHLAQTLSLVAHKASLFDHDVFKPIAEVDTLIADFLGKDKLLDFHLHCLWGAHWRLRHPHERMGKKEKALLLGKAVVCSVKAGMGEFEPSVEIATDLRERIAKIPANWVHKASVYLQWGLEPGNYERLLKEVDRMIDERREKDTYLLVAAAHALAAVVRREDIDSVSAFDRLKTLACLGKKEKPRTKPFLDVRYHAWCHLFSLGNDWPYASELAQQLQSDTGEKCEEVRALLEEGKAPYNCDHYKDVRLSSDFPEMDLNWIDQLVDMRQDLSRQLREMQATIIFKLCEIRVDLEQAKWERLEIKRIVGRMVRLQPSPRVDFRIDSVNTSLVQNRLRPNRRWHSRLTGDLGRLPFEGALKYEKVWDAFFSNSDGPKHVILVDIEDSCGWLFEAMERDVPAPVKAVEVSLVGCLSIFSASLGAVVGILSTPFCHSSYQQNMKTHQLAIQHNNVCRCRTCTGSRSIHFLEHIRGVSPVVEQLFHRQFPEAENTIYKFARNKRRGLKLNPHHA